MSLLATLVTADAAHLVFGLLLLDSQAPPPEAFPTEQQDGGGDQMELHCSQLQRHQGDTASALRATGLVQETRAPGKLQVSHDQ